MKRGIVFDMDKCMGYFTQIALYMDIIQDLSRTLKVKEYYDMFNMFPEIFRPGIFNVFRYLVGMKKKCKIEIVIYTNNNGPPSWATNIRKYIEYKIKHKLFDRTIKGWKYDNKIIEEKRSGYEKSWEDLIECTRLNKNDKIIFFDDRDEHYQMKHENVNYVKVVPYRVDILHKDFVDKFIKSKLNKKLKVNKEDLIRECNRSGYRASKFRKYSNDDIMKPLREFMKVNRKKTRRRKRKANRTRKKKGGKHTKSLPKPSTERGVTVTPQIQNFIGQLSPETQNNITAHIINNRRTMNRRGVGRIRQDAHTTDFLNGLPVQLAQLRRQRRQRLQQQEEPTQTDEIATQTDEIATQTNE
jgi:hypothetical protein